jgi:hypothetical protein
VSNEGGEERRSDAFLVTPRLGEESLDGRIAIASIRTEMLAEGGPVHHNGKHALRDGALIGYVSFPTHSHLRDRDLAN